MSTRIVVCPSMGCSCSGSDCVFVMACCPASSSATAAMDYAQNVGLTLQPAFATQCVGCGKCESHCPQHLPIREKLKEADRALRPLPFKIGIRIARSFMNKKA